MSALLGNMFFAGLQFGFLAMGLVEGRSVWLPLFCVCFHGAIVTYLLRLHRKEKGS